jgi:hypothetical protein
MIHDFLERAVKVGVRLCGGAETEVWAEVVSTLFTTCAKLFVAAWDTAFDSDSHARADRGDALTDGNDNAR